MPTDSSIVKFDIFKFLRTQNVAVDAFTMEVMEVTEWQKAKVLRQNEEQKKGFKKVICNVWDMKKFDSPVCSSHQLIDNKTYIM